MVFKITHQRRYGRGDDECFEDIDRSDFQVACYYLPCLVVDIRWWLNIPTQPHSARWTDSQCDMCPDLDRVGYCGGWCCWRDNEGGRGFIKSCSTPLNALDKGVEGWKKLPLTVEEDVCCGDERVGEVHVRYRRLMQRAGSPIVGGCFHCVLFSVLPCTILSLISMWSKAALT